MNVQIFVLFLWCKLKITIIIIIIDIIIDLVFL